MGIERTNLNIIKAIYDKPIVNIIFSDEKQEVSSKIRKKDSLSSLLFNIVLEVLGTRIREEKKKKIKEIYIGKKEAKLSLFADDMILYIHTRS